MAARERGHGAMNGGHFYGQSLGKSERPRALKSIAATMYYPAFAYSEQASYVSRGGCSYGLRRRPARFVQGAHTTRSPSAWSCHGCDPRDRWVWGRSRHGPLLSRRRRLSVANAACRRRDGSCPSQGSIQSVAQYRAGFDQCRAQCTYSRALSTKAAGNIFCNWPSLRNRTARRVMCG